MKRDFAVDAIAGLLIVYMILVHLLQQVGIYSGKVLYYMQFLNFYIPWFFYKSGMFYHGTDSKKLIGGGKNLLRLFAQFSVVGYVVYIFVIWINNDYNWIHYILTPIKSLLLSGSVPGNEPLWFLLSLFIVRIIGCRIVSQSSLNKIIGVVFLCFSLSWMYYIYHIMKPDYLLNITSGLGFFLIGYLMRNNQYKRSIFFICIVIYFTLCVFLFTSVEMRHNLLERGIFFLWPITCLTGIVSINNIFRLVPQSFLKPLAYAGKHSVQLLVWHYPLILLLFHINKIF